MVISRIAAVSAANQGSLQNPIPVKALKVPPAMAESQLPSDQSPCDAYCTDDEERLTFLI